MFERTHTNTITRIDYGLTDEGRLRGGLAKNSVFWVPTKRAVEEDDEKNTRGRDDDDDHTHSFRLVRKFAC